MSERYSGAIVWPAEGDRVALVTCKDCGAAILLSMIANSMALHDEWHKVMNLVYSRANMLGPIG